MQIVIIRDREWSLPDMKAALLSAGHELVGMQQCQYADHLGTLAGVDMAIVILDVPYQVTLSTVSHARAAGIPCLYTNSAGFERWLKTATREREAVLSTATVAVSSVAEKVEALAARLEVP